MKTDIKYFLDRIDAIYRFTFMDVGAMGGIPQKWNCIRDFMNVIAFEPDLREFAKLKDDASIRYLNYALHNRSENLKYYITISPGKSSILEPNMDVLWQYEDEERYRVIREEVIPSSRVRNIDSVIEENSIQDVDFIKLDTQGSELSILQGGQTKLMHMLFGAQIEVEFINIYKNQPVFRNIDEFMDGNGFSLIDIRRQYWKRKDHFDYRGKGQLIFGDALYFKKINILLGEISKIDEASYGASKIFKSILVCMIYKMFDYAVAVAKGGLENGYLSDIEYQDAILEIKKNSLRGLYFRSKMYSKIYYAISMLLRGIKPKSYLGWADSDREIGNIDDV
jgi:FkbM family methyltransferase